MTVTSQWIEIESDDGQRFDGYLALPRAGRGPGVLIMQEIFGVNGHIRSIAEQYALAGYVALVPDMFWRTERRVELGYDGRDREKAMSLLKSLDIDRTVADFGAGVRALKARSELAGPVAAVGYCIGGQIAYRMAAQRMIDAAIAYYGGGIQNLLDQADDIDVPILFHFGDRDASIPIDAVKTIEARFAGKANAELYVYPGAGHGFNCTDRASYDQRASALALGRTMTFLATRT
jgi:carboxymethylenebutenolidase